MRASRADPHRHTSIVAAAKDRLLFFRHLRLVATSPFSMSAAAKSVATAATPPTLLGYKIAVLVFIENSRGEQLLLLRAKAPNLGTWSPIGGKLETAIGESPFECAVRETREETGHIVTPADLHLFAMIAEKAYEGASHWLLFLFRCTKPLDSLPAAMDEGRFGFFSRAEIEKLPLPETDRTALWQIYDQHRDRFVALRADCAPEKPLEVVIEQITPPRRASPNHCVTE